MTTPMTKAKVMAVLDRVALDAERVGIEGLPQTLREARATIAAWNVSPDGDVGKPAVWVSADTFNKIGKSAVAANLYGYKPWPRNNKRNHIPLYTNPAPSPDGDVVDLARRMLAVQWRTNDNALYGDLCRIVRAGDAQLAQQGGESK